MAFRGEACGRSLGHNGRPLMNGIWALIKKTPETSFAPFLMWGPSEKTATYELGNEPDTEPAGTLILDFQPPELWEINFCSPSLWYSIIVAQTKATAKLLKKQSNKQKNTSNIFISKICIYQSRNYKKVCLQCRKIPPNIYFFADWTVQCGVPGQWEAFHTVIQGSGLRLQSRSVSANLAGRSRAKTAC